ncbi:D-3-phosphoglycerate dehydrogenase [Sporomusaceae bacterium BoRhaA]|uniref:phosphoglycerate dehydrogenase n=1 Tax=Pelorhabdus rhamnosifermentans TaxID=2772457 RepID=UPI001C061E84|nr:phosphoglycerate dehydrogenase [Pelorhabdus rhamnosifermentans]MBU2701796.1 D-3-phosphoglycerate dehydrogenase [Pelorhabdus rhamnosifermentans]
MKNILITSKSFGSQLDREHKEQLIQYFEENDCHIIWNSTDHAMSAQDIINVDAEQSLDAIVVYSSSDEMNHTVFEYCRNLKVVSRHGVGIENIDALAAKRAGVQIKTTTAMPGNETVADLAFALLLSVARKVTVIDAQLRQNHWHRPISRDVWGKTLGIIGLGRIGKAVVKRAQGFGMNILAYTGHPDKNYLKKNGITLCTKEELIAKADFITLHCTLNEETRGLIGVKEFFLMKRTAYLINTARSGLVDQRALLEALKNDEIAGVAIDVFDIEPVVDDPLIKENLENVVATAHVGSYTFDSIKRMDFLVAENVVQTI